jgi:hypothetical protein
LPRRFSEIFGPDIRIANSNSNPGTGKQKKVNGKPPMNLRKTTLQQGFLETIELFSI